MEKAIVLSPDKNTFAAELTQPVRVLQTSVLADIPVLLDELAELVEEQGFFAVGWVSYEAAPAFDETIEVNEGNQFPLLYFALFQGYKALKKPPTGWQEKTESVWLENPLTQATYQKNFALIHQGLMAGDVYQVNHTFKLKGKNPVDGERYFWQLMEKQKTPYGLYMQSAQWSVLSCSPELFFRQQGEKITMRPMKGTLPRLPEQQADSKQAEQLRASIKDRAENVMIVDMIRNDLSRISQQSVKTESLFNIERYATVWQMTSTVSTETAVELSSLFRAVFPCASITGAPKVAACALIKQTETEPRELYTGAIGFLAANKTRHFSVGIRTLLLDHQRDCSSYSIGSGIVADSNAEDEWRECFNKFAFVCRPASQIHTLFETILYEPNKGYWLQHEHVQRLCRSASYFIDDFDVAQAKQKIEMALQQLQPSLAKKLSNQRVKLNLHLPPWYEPANAYSLTVDTADIAPLVSPYRVRILPNSVNANDISLYHKSNNRDVYRKALTKAQQDTAGIADVILCNENGEITESTIANVVLVLDGKHLTPTLDAGLLAGCLRQSLLQRGEITERKLTIEDLLRADEVYFINALRGKFTVELVR